MHFDKTNNTRLDFNDLLIQPAVKTDIDSRSQVNPYDHNGMLPIFTAPMDTVVDARNVGLFLSNKINVCMPRGANIEAGTHFESFRSISLDDFIKKYIDSDYNCIKEYVLIDIANGHMKKMFNAVTKAKEKYGDKLFLMVGNVANPKTYRELSDAGADAVRIGIGNGNGCLTTQQTGVGYPMASLIRECYYQGFSAIDNRALIVADGGMKNYSDIIKALALGADYVMVGSILNKCLESCGETRLWKFIKINAYCHPRIAQWLHKNGFKLTKKFRGMSTKEVQKNWGNEVLKTSEGVVRIRPVEYTIEQWSTNFTDYLRSAMSYTNCKTLEEFRSTPAFNVISDQAYQRFNK